MDNANIERRALAIGIATALSIVTGCGADAEVPPSEATATATAPLRYFQNPNGVQCHNPAVTASHWAPGDTLELCFTGPAGASFQADVQDAIGSTWGAAANLVLHWNGACPGPIPPDWVSIHVAEVSQENFCGGTGEPGFRNRLAPDCERSPGWDFRSDVQVQITGTPSCRKAIAVHEFGHALGFEHERPDVTCTPWPSSSTALTVFDKISMMGSCPGLREPADYRLSPLDILGADLMYPRQYTHAGGCGERCLSGPGGTRLFVRADGTFTSDWKAKGAYNMPMQYRDKDNVVQLTEYVSASRVQSGPFSFIVTNQRGTATRAGQIDLTLGNSYHTALVMTAVGVAGG